MKDDNPIRFLPAQINRATRCIYNAPRHILSSIQDHLPFSLHATYLS